jgi:lipopolysaccharide transport system ATP-binding protein
MSDIVISVENLSKRCLVGRRSGASARYATLRDIITREAQNFARKAVDAFHGRQIVQGDEVEEFWALKDVSFEVQRGEVIGIIGRNGAGKSTLLKILSRITEPTAGRARLRGRLASLLEVGTGFHPELTGRENIYLNGALLGMSRKEIKGKFDDIVAFAETERFLDTPVKRYSSGMYVRLAFSIAAHLEPEIFVIDEVLAVGDMDFQKKCLGKMSEVAKGGRTVLFVSHNLGSVAALCNHGLLLEQGRVKRWGPIRDVIEHYCAASGGSYETSFAANESKPSITRIVLNEAELQRGNFCCSMDFRSPFPLRPPVGGFVINDRLERPFGAATAGSIRTADLAHRIWHAALSVRQHSAGAIDL